MKVSNEQVFILKQNSINNFKKEVILLAYEKIDSLSNVETHLLENAFDYVKFKTDSFNIFSEKNFTTLFFSYFIIGSFILEDEKFTSYLYEQELSENERVKNFINFIEHA